MSSEGKKETVRKLGTKPDINSILTQSSDYLSIALFSHEEKISTPDTARRKEVMCAVTCFQPQIATPTHHNELLVTQHVNARYLGATGDPLKKDCSFSSNLMKFPLLELWV